MKETEKYIPLWTKYLPALRILFKKALESKQQLQLYKHDFEISGDRDKSGYTFNLEVKNGRVVNNIIGTAVARDLYKVLKGDERIMSFLLQNDIKLSLIKSYMLTIERI
jgi:hypothetical protein